MTILWSATSLLFASVVWVLVSNVDAFAVGEWKGAFATFYGERDGSGATGGACGYEDTTKEGYGLMTAALSTALFNKGATCGACYEITCDPKGTQFCTKGAGPIFVTATDYCPPNPAQPSDNGGWCNPPREHFDLSQPAFLQMAEYKAGIVPVQYRRVPCKKTGGIRFTITGNPNFFLVKVFNVGGAGDVVGLKVSQGNSGGKWTNMNRNWGQKWDTNVNLLGDSVSFQVTTSDGQSLTLQNVVDKTWQLGQTFQSNNNF